MKKILVSIVALTSIVIGGGLSASTADRASAERSPEAQIQRANALWQKVFQAPNEQARQDAIRATCNRLIAAADSTRLVKRKVQRRKVVPQRKRRPPGRR